jgi:hypothetical protein
MEKRKVILSLFCLSFAYAQAQKKYEKIMYTEVSSETSDMTITAKNAVSQPELTKFNLKISNKTDDILLYKPEESKLKANGKEFIPKEKWLTVSPAETDNRVVDIKGTEFLIPAYSFEVNGIYKVSTTNKSVEAADFQLPASQNEFKAGNFTCNMLDLSKETDKTWVKFECRYMGDKIGVIHAGRAAIRLPDGTEIANAKSKKAPIIVKKGESEKITLAWDRMEGGKATDMQKIKLVIVWRNTFIESDAVKLAPVVLDFKIDEAKSK